MTISSENQKRGPIHWTNVTGFLRWTPQTDGADNPYYLAQIELAQMGVVVSRDTSGQTWGVTINGETLSDEYPSALSAQIAAMGLVVWQLAEEAGDAAKDSTTDAQKRCRMLLEELHSLTRCDDTDLSQRARERLWPYPQTQKGGA